MNSILQCYDYFEAITFTRQNVPKSFIFVCTLENRIKLNIERVERVETKTKYFKTLIRNQVSVYKSL